MDYRFSPSLVSSFFFSYFISLVVTPALECSQQSQKGKSRLPQCPSLLSPRSFTHFYFCLLWPFLSSSISLFQSISFQCLFLALLNFLSPSPCLLLWASSVVSGGAPKATPAPPNATTISASTALMAIPPPTTLLLSLVRVAITPRLFPSRSWAGSWLPFARIPGMIPTIPLRSP